MSAVSPKELILQARKFETGGFILEAWRSYGEAIDMIKKIIACVEDKRKIERFIENLTTLENGKRRLEARIEPDNQTARTIRIAEGATGYSYSRLFGDYLDETVKEVHINEAYIFERHQIENLICFLDLLVRKCKNLRYVCLFTLESQFKNERNDNKSLQKRKNVFDDLVKQFENYGVVFRYRFSRVGHYRRIFLGNGTTFVLDRGMDIYQMVKPFSLGYFDYDLRKCKESYVDILQIPNMMEFEDGE